jgi:hypothetical protein
MTSENTNDITQIDDFDELLNQIKADTNLVDNLTDEQVTELRKKFNPYGRTIEGQGKLTCLSITNMSEEYMKKFLMTALIGFVYRQCDEHELDPGEPPCHMDNYEEFTATYDTALSDGKNSLEWMRRDNSQHQEDEKRTPSESAERLHHKRIVDRAEGFRRRLVVRQFLDTLFQFNPDKHVRSAYSNNPLDPERVAPAHVKQKPVKTTKTLIGRNGEKKVINVKPVENDMSVDEQTKRANSASVKHIPPADVFHRWQYYNDTNYEEIRSATTDLYCVKPDIEFAINPYDQFNDQESANKFIQKHKNEVIADILTLTNGKWNLTGSFKNNRDRINYYNDKTVVIEEMFKQMEQDKKLGADLMRKRVERLKKKNVDEYGQEPKEFKQYRKDHVSAFESMGAENVLRDENKSTKTDDVTFKNHEDCPYDAVQVDVINMSNGGLNVKRSEFFTQAESPEVP